MLNIDLLCNIQNHGAAIQKQKIKIIRMTLLKKIDLSIRCVIRHYRYQDFPASCKTDKRISRL